MTVMHYWTGVSILNDRNIPFSDLVRNFFATKPKDVDGVANASSVYYQQKLLRQVFSRFEFRNFPDEWDTDYCLEHLFLDGFFCITDTAMGVIPLKCG